jgi:hypothetical protein
MIQIKPTEELAGKTYKNTVSRCFSNLGYFRLTQNNTRWLKR